MVDPYELREGLYLPPFPVRHREEDFESGGFDQLRAMQERHFWYRGRHRFLLHAVRRHLGRIGSDLARVRMLDLGGGCGGWLTYWLAHGGGPVAEMALADSSRTALEMAAAGLPSGVRFYQADLINLGWEDRWELVFLLDVLEHVEEDERALAEVFEALTPGGLLLITTPAFRAFWTWNDAISGHRRRYTRGDFRRLADRVGFRFVEARYFMFFLSPLLLLSRLLTGPGPGRGSPSADQIQDLVRSMHRVPSRPLNALLGACFHAETPLGFLVPFPWGTSVLAVLQKPAST